MDTRTSWIVGVIVVVAVLAGAWFLWGQPAATTQQVNVNTTTGQNATSSGSTQTSTTTGTGTGATVGAGGSISVGTPVTVHLTASGFSPSSVTIKKGQSVTWVNDTAGSMWVASAQHPTHIVYSGTSLSQHCPDVDKNDFDQCANGNTFTFTFDKAGTWKYHNHSNASQFGSVVVE